MKLKQFLTIGDVSKIMNVNIKSLRYYDRIGVLTPSYVDPETNYRYYLPSQLAVVQAIQFCIEIGIPLKRFSAFYEDNKISTLTLLEEAQNLAEQKIQMLRNGLALMEDLRQTIEKNEVLENSSQLIEYELAEKWVMVEEFDGTHQEMENEMNLNRTLSKLQMETLNRGLKNGFLCGYLNLYEGGTLHRHIFTEVFGDIPPQGKDIIHFPTATWKSICVQSASIGQAERLFSEEFSKGGRIAVLETEIVSGVFNTQKPKYELRCCRF